MSSSSSPQRSWLRSRWWVTVQWVLATAIGFWLSLLWVEIGERPDLGVFNGSIGAVTIALTQLPVLAKRIDRAPWWIVASIASWGLLGLSPVGALGWVAPRTLDLGTRAFYGAIEGVKIGIVTGIAQWLVLKLSLPRAWRWIPVNAIAWAIALALGWTIGGILRRATHLFLSEPIGLSVVWIAIATLTGVALAALLPDRERSE